ncbi:VCBS domain-containing protein [Mesorhizobium sp. M7A.F.Ca.CA.004.04.1.1]|uniref:VCBS domain-containing protein n=1 Tax=Mesorhizobium sp. M7A.F.Ca.CA.004.04.1.1 TaxID=2496733 RepID=UPI0013E394E5|nr:VCBS domain-containing protein [Mesorhizobium sp. M7A.F.Ca.CA.004.04.1.1]
MATQVTGAGGTTTSFSNTPQAKDDLLAFSEDATGVLILNVLANDLGGAATQLYSIDNADSLTTATKIYAPTDLLARDITYSSDSAALAALPATANTSFLGARIWISADGTIHYNKADIDAQVQALGQGQILTDRVTYAIQLGNGTLSWATATIQFTGINDAAVITVNGAEDTSVTEKSGVANGTPGDATASGDLDATDVDSSALFTVQSGVAKTYGTFSIDANGTWSYTLDDNNAVVQALNSTGANTTLHELVTVTTADGTQKVIDITIHGANDAAVITVNGAEDTSVTERSGVANGTPGDATAAGDLNATDVDNAATFNVQFAVAKTYGTFSIDANGTWSYTLDDNNAAVQALNSTGANTTLHELVTVTTADGTTKDIVISINGANDAAVITGDASGSLTEASGVANATAGTSPATGDLNATDVDNTATFNTQAAVAKTYGTFSMDVNGAWSYTLDDANAAVQALNSTGANTTLHELVTVTTLDGTQKVIDITIHGANDAAVLSSASANLTETNSAADISTSGTLTISDVDSPATFVAQAATAGTYGTFAINAAGAWTYTASSAHDEFVAGQHYTENFDVVSADGTHTSVAIDVLGTADAPPRFAPTDIQLTPSTTTDNVTFSSFQFTGTLSATDADPGGFVYSITSQSDPGLFSIAGNTLSSGDLSPSKAYSITVQSTQVGDPVGPAYQYSETFQVITGSNGNSSDNLSSPVGGDDILYGNGGADQIFGLAGNDRLVGGAGADTLSGGLGADTFYYGSAVAGSAPGAGSFDTITDFVHGVDKIDLSSIDASGAAGDQAFLFGGQNVNTVASSITWSESGGNTIVRADVTGNTGADFQITLTGTGLGLTASDFVL